MASITIPKPGSDFGPCENPSCGHVDCGDHRCNAAKLCTICRKPIGYDRHCYLNGDDSPCHHVCLVEKLENRRTG